MLEVASGFSARVTGNGRSRKSGPTRPYVVGILGLVFKDTLHQEGSSSASSVCFPDKRLWLQPE